MDYITVKEAAAQWGTAERSVQNYCANEKIPGTKCIGGQWFIPLDAKPPLDGRTKAAKAWHPTDNYRFPVLVYSRYYRDSSELTQEEQSLLKAQILHFEGNHMQSLILCQNLLEKNLPRYLKAGVYMTIGIDSFLLGLISQYEEAVAVLERFTVQETEHTEDFLLMTAALKFYTDWDSSRILKIRPLKLSSDGVWYYQTMLLTVSVMSGTVIPIYTLRFWESECPFFEKEGMTPMLYLFLCGLGVLEDHDRTKEERESLLNRGVALAIEHNWLPNLTRFYNFSPTCVEKSVKAHGEMNYREFMKAHEIVMNNWNILHSKETGFNLTGTFNPKQMELLLLISYGYTDKEIALCLSLSKDAVKQKIKSLMEISKTDSKAHLRAFARKLFDSSFHIH